MEARCDEWVLAVPHTDITTDDEGRHGHCDEDVDEEETTVWCLEDGLMNAKYKRPLYSQMSDAFATNQKQVGNARKAINHSNRC